MRNKTTNIYTEWLPLIEGFPDEQVGKLFKNILKYQNGEDINDSNPVWLFIKSKIDEYNQKLSNISEKRKKSGSYGGMAKASKCQQVLANDSKCSNKIKEKKIKENKIKQNNNNLILYNDPLNDAIQYWLAYKREKRQSYTPTGLKDCIEKLRRLSNNNQDLAMQIVKQSTSNGYSGLFPLKGGGGQKESVFEQNMRTMKEMEEANADEKLF